MNKIIFIIFTILFYNNSIIAYEISADGENQVPFSNNEYMELAVPVGEQVFVNLQGTDPENGPIYFIITNNANLNYGSAKIINSNKFKYTAKKDITTVTKNGLNCNDIGSVCDYVKYKIKDSKGAYSKEYTVNVRIQELFDKDSYDPHPDKGFNARAFNTHMMNNMSNNENSFMNSSDPTGSFSQQVNQMFPGSVDFASGGTSGGGFTNDSLKNNPNSRSALINLQGDGNLAQNNTILNDGFYSDIKKLAYRHHPITEKTLKTCRIERAGGVLKTFFICPLDSNYPDNISDATLFRAAYGEEDKAQSLCENTCREKASCNLAQPFFEIPLFKNKSALTKQDALGMQEILRDKNVTKLRIIVKDSQGNMISDHNETFTSDINGSLFHWHNDVNGSDIHIYDFDKARNTYTVPGTNVKYVYNIANPNKTSEYYSFNNDKGLLEVIVPRFFWMEIGSLSTEPKNDRLYSVIATVRQDMYRCPINNLPKNSILYDDKEHCNNICSIGKACVKNTYVEVEDMDNIENYCKDMTIMYENTRRSLESLANEGKCKIYEESVVDFSTSHKNYFVKDFQISDPFRPFGDFNDTITEFPTKTSQLINENVIGVLGAFQNMLQTQGSITKVDKSLPLNSEEYIDLKGNKINHMFYPFSILLYSGMSNSNRQVGLVIRPNPKVVNKMKDAHNSQNYGFVVISFEPDIRTFSNHDTTQNDETIARYFLIDRDYNRTLVREENLTGSYNRNTMSTSGYMESDFHIEKNIDQFLPIIYNNNDTNEDLDNAFFDYQFLRNVNFLDNPESKLFVYYDTIENLNNTNIQDIIRDIKSDYITDKKYLALDYFYVNDILQTRQDVSSIASDGQGNYVVTFDSKEKYYGTLGPSFEKYLKQFPGNSDTPSFLFDETVSRDDAISISRRGVDTNMSIDVKISPDLNETKNGYYFTYFKKDGDDEAYFVFPVGTEGNYISEGGSYQCGITHDIFGSVNSCNNYCLDGNYVTNIDQSATLVRGTCTLSGATTNTSGVLYNNEENCILGSDIPSITNAQSNIVNARLRFDIQGQPLSKLYNLNLNRYKSLGSVTPYLNYDSKIVDNGTMVTFGNQNILNINGLKKNEKLIFNFNSKYLNSRYWIGLGIWNADDIKNTLGREPLSEDIHINSKLDNGYCFDIQKYYEGVKLYFEIDKDFDGEYEESVAVMEPFICSHANTNSLELKIEFLGNKIRYDYIHQDGEITSNNISELIYKQKGNCRVLSSTERQDAINNGMFSSKWNGVLPSSALTNNIFGVYKYNSTPSLENLSEFKNARNGRTEKIFLKRVNIDNFKSISDANISDLKKYIKNPALMPIPIDFGAYKEDRANFLFRQLNTSGFEDYKLYAGYGHEPWSNCLNFKSPITVSKNIVDSSAPLSNGCPAGYSYDTVTTICSKQLIPNSNNGVCPYNSRYNDIKKRCEKVNTSAYIAKFKATNAQSKFNIVHKEFIESMSTYGTPTIGGGDYNATFKGDVVSSNTKSTSYDFIGKITDGENIIELNGDIEDINFSVKYDRGVFNKGDGIIEIEKVLACPSILPNADSQNICYTDVNCRLDGTAPSAIYDPVNNTCKTSFTDPCTDGKIYDNATGECQKNTTEIVQVEQNIKICKPWWVIQRVYKCDPDIYDTNFIEDRLSFSYPRRVQMCLRKETVQKTVFMDTNGTIE